MEPNSNPIWISFEVLLKNMGAIGFSNFNHLRMKWMFTSISQILPNCHKYIILFNYFVHPMYTENNYCLKKNSHQIWKFAILKVEFTHDIWMKKRWERLCNTTCPFADISPSEIHFWHFFFSPFKGSFCNYWPLPQKIKIKELLPFSLAFKCWDPKKFSIVENLLFCWFGHFKCWLFCILSITYVTLKFFQSCSIS
jgi:hypothetical protein